MPQARLPLENSRAGLKGIGGIKLLKNAAILPAGLWDSEKILQQHRFGVAFGVGGYTSGPMMLAARLHGIPSVIFEPNVEPGFTNRVLAGISTRVALRVRGNGRALWRESGGHGIPVRKEFSAAPRREHHEPFNILITGGSQRRFADQSRGGRLAGPYS